MMTGRLVEDDASVCPEAQFTSPPSSCAFFGSPDKPSSRVSWCELNICRTELFAAASLRSVQMGRRGVLFSAAVPPLSPHRRVAVVAASAYPRDPVALP